MTIEEQIYFTQFPEETEIDWSNYYDWVNDEPLRAYEILLEIAKTLNQQP